MKTMGFKHLRLIAPKDHLGEEARMLAHGSHEILESARLFDDYNSAVADLDLVVCTTAKGRTSKHDYHSSRDIREQLEKKKEQLQQVGILFGTEESGLPNTLVLQSDLAMSIPMSVSYPSLNLAQAVMISAYELSPLNQLNVPGEMLVKSGEGWGTLKRQAATLLQDAGIMEGTPLYHRIMERLATLSGTDIPLFLSVLSRIQEK